MTARDALRELCAPYWRRPFGVVPPRILAAWVPVRLALFTKEHLERKNPNQTPPLPPAGTATEGQTAATAQTHSRE